MVSSLNFGDLLRLEIEEFGVDHKLKKVIV
jgi:hypothetical protein